MPSAISPILLATDLSPWCDRAKERALWLARRDRRRLRILHVTDSPGRAGHHLAAMLADEAPDIEAEVVIRAGEPWEEIDAEAAALDPFVVMVGRHRPDALRDFFLAPTATLVEAGPPVLQAVNLHAGPWRRVVVGTDFSPLAQTALAAALALAPEAPFHLLHAFEMPFAGFITNRADTREVMDRHRADLETAGRAAIDAAGGQGRDIELLLARGGVVPTLHAEARRLDADLLVIGTGGGGGQAFGSTARALTADPPCDLLVVPPRRS